MSLPPPGGASAPGSPWLRRAGSLLGVLGVAAFVGGWITGAARRPGYSPVHQAISQLARYGRPDRWLMESAFVAFGLGVLLLGGSVAAAWRRPLLGGLVALSGLATLSVALFPLSAAGGGSEDTRHAVSAGVGYAALALAPLAGCRAVGLPRLSVLAALATAVALVLTLPARDTGLWQRIGLSTGDLWLVLLSTRLSARARPAR